MSVEPMFSEPRLGALVFFVRDLARSQGVDEVVSADVHADEFDSLRALGGFSKLRSVALDAGDHGALVSILEAVDVAIDLLPRQFMINVCAAAIETGTGVVNTNYASAIAHFDGPAREAGIAILPECGLDPGIDLVLYGEAARRFDRLEVIRSYCGGFPAPSAADNVLKYKLSWTWEASEPWVTSVEPINGSQSPG